MTNTDKTPVPIVRINGNARWWGAIIVALLTGSGGGAFALLRGDPKVAELEEKIEATKERRVDKIESDVSALKLGFERIDRNIIRIGERVRAKDLETGDDR